MKVVIALHDAQAVGAPAAIGDSIVQRFYLPQIDARMVNLGLGGSTSQQWCQWAPGLQAPTAAEYVMVHLGTNDVTQIRNGRQTFEQVAASFRCVLDAISVPIVIAGPHNWAEGPVADLTAQVIDMQRAECEARPACRFIPSNLGGAPSSYFAGGLHPSAAGYALWAQVLQPSASGQ